MTAAPNPGEAGLESALDALEALEGSLGSPWFWHPATFLLIPGPHRKAYLNRVASRFPGGLALLEEARAMKNQQTDTRVSAVQQLLWERGLALCEPNHESLCYALCWVAKLPYGLFRNGRIAMDVDLRGQPITWLPTGFQSWGALNLAGTPIQELPGILLVTGDLHLEDTGISRLPDGLRVDGALFLRGTPLATRPFEELRSMAPKVRGTIFTI